MASVTVTMSGDDARLIAAHERLFSAQQKALDNYAKNVAKAKEAQASANADLESRKAAAEAEKARLAIVERGQKLIANQRDAQQKYNDSIKEAEELAKAGAISDTDLAKRKSILANELREATGEAKKHADMLKRGQEITAASISPTDKYKSKVKELLDLHKQGAIDAKTFASAQKEAKDELTSAGGAAGGLVSSIGEMATAYGLVELAAGGINSLLEEQNKLQELSLQKSQALATAQSDAVKNLIGLNFAESGAMLKEAEAIAQRTGFEDRAKLAQSLGAAVSAGATVEQATSAVENAAKINKQTPDQLSATSSGAVDIGRATGIVDAQQNMGFALDVQAVSRVERFDKLQNALAKTLTSAIAVMPEIDRAIASRQSAALYATTNTLANDVQGESTATANVQFETYLAKFFDNAGLKDVSEKIQRLEAKKEVTDSEAFKIKAAEEKVAKSTGKEKEKAEVMLNDIRARATLTEAEASKLAKLKEQQAEFTDIKDPGSTRGRILALQNADEETRARFFDKMPGEAIFKKPLELIATKGTEAFAMFEANFTKKIDFGADTFTEAEKRIKTATPELALADTRATAESNTTGFDLSPRTTVVADVKKLLAETQERVRSENTAFATIQWAADWITKPMRAMSMNNPESAIETTRDVLSGRRTRLVDEAMTNPFDGRTFDPSSEAAEKIRYLDKQLEVLNKFEQIMGGAGKKMDEAANKQIEAANRNNAGPVSVAPGARAMANTGR